MNKLFKRRGGGQSKHRVRLDDEDDEGFFSDEDNQIPLEGLEVEDEIFESDDSDSSDDDDEELTSDEEVENVSTPPSVGTFGNSLGVVLNDKLTKKFSVNDDSGETAIKYGDNIRLYTVSRYADSTEGAAGGYIGYYLRGGPAVDASGNITSKHKNKGRLMVAVPPIGGQQHLFAESCFEVVDPTGFHREGDFLRYGDEVALLDDQNMVWNNVQNVGGIGPKLPGSRGEMRLKMRRLNTPPTVTASANGSSPVPEQTSDIVHYGDSDVLLDVVTLRRRVKTKKYSQTITNYKKKATGPEGGYLVSNGRGLGISFAIHHAQPYCLKLTIRVPQVGSKMPALLAAQDAANRDIDDSKDEKQLHHHVTWGVPIPFTATSAFMSNQARSSIATAATNTNNDEEKVPDKPFISFTLTNGGRGVVSAKQVVSSAKNPNGFWVDLTGRGSKSGKLSKGCVRVSCCRENIENMTRRLSRLDGDNLQGTEALLAASGGPGQVVLRKLNRLRKIPKDLAFGSLRSARIVGGGLVGAGRNIKRGIRADNIKNVPHHIKNAPSHIQKEVGTLFRKVGGELKQVGGGIHRRVKSSKTTATVKSPVRKGSNEVLSDDELSDTPQHDNFDGTNGRITPLKSVPNTTTSPASLVLSPKSSNKNVTIVTPTELPSVNSNALTTTSSNIEVKKQKKSFMKKKTFPLIVFGVTLLVGAVMWSPDEVITANITALSLSGGDVWWAPTAFKAVLLAESLYSKVINMPLMNALSLVYSLPLSNSSIYLMVGVVLLVLAWAGFSMTSGKTKPTSSNPELTQEDQCIWELTLHEWDPRSADELNSIGATSNDSSTRPKPVMGASIDLANEMSLSNRWKDVWSPVDAAKFQVRSATYLSDKVKAPSAPSLFGAIGGDCVVSNGPIRHFANRVELPSTATQLPNYKDDAVVPALFIINIQIPIQPRAMFGAAKLLPTVNAVFYLRLTQDTAENLLKIEEDPEAVRGPVKLLHRWCRDAQTDDVLRGALKLIGFGRNFSELGAPSFVQNYNGKPVLLAGGGLTGNRLGFAQIYRGPNYLEVDIDVASHFTYLSQRGICWALGLCDNLLADVAFVIEGRSEDELPECLLGSVSMSKMPILNALDEAAVFGPSQSVGNPDGGGGDDGSDSNEQTTSRNSGDKNTTD